MKHQNEGAPGGRADFRLHAPATARNRDAILEKVGDLVASDARVLEIGSGTGEHAVHIARQMPDLVWQTSDPDPTMRASTRAWIDHTGVTNVREPLSLDCGADGWWRDVDVEPDLMIAINFTHIVPITCIDGLLAGAGALLPPDGLLALYGAFTFNGVYSAATNRSFDRMLRQQNAAWGLRDLNDISAGANRHGLKLDQIIAMPSNNHMVTLKRGEGAFG